MNRNTNLFLAIADKIEADPAAHKQSVWAAEGTDVRDDGTCGTAACIAGWSVFLAKPHWIVQTAHPDITDWYEFSLDTRLIRDQSDIDISLSTWIAVGQALLGITEPEAQHLFDGSALPTEGTWPEALRKIAAGADIFEVIER